MSEEKSFDRRTFMRGALAAAALAPLGGALASCAAGGGGSASTGASSAAGGASGAATGAAKASADNPFGLAKGSTIDAVIFNGGYGTDYVDFAAKIVQKDHEGVTTKVSPSTQIAQELQPRFVSGNPPDLIDDSGANKIGYNAIVSQLEDLEDVVNAKNLEGKTIKDTLYPGTLDPGMFNGKMAAINYVLTIYGVWYSSSLFDQHGWQPPKTWDEAMALGKKAKAEGKYLFVWGKEAANYYEKLTVGSAIKEGGDEVRLALGNLEPKCWSHPAIQGVFKALEAIVKAGYVKPGGAGTQFTRAQAQWSQAEQAILYPSGSWIENEMKKQTKAGFKMKGFPAMTLTDHAAMPHTALHSEAAEAYIVPSKGHNPAGGKELLRTMLSKEAAANFAKTRLASTIVKGTVPADGFGSTALQSQIQMLDAAGKDVFSFQFSDIYGMGADELVLWNSFLAGNANVSDLTQGLQKITDKVRNDDSIKKIKVT
ncbi:MAG TPA: N-acetylglucosamine/diacetylchitobiose ABC transporter substrate-binding protein [Segeticoccus sp.]|uniref:N-acetylglucosamine/diacetylchitobiose ABC transporter substrate-binding protein n=1 Tax=Segeticoccus sp. TaxID=2706531 RepID=UPI002D802C60|nr:N-acetylglucosamine/diacetylchitobiose ABC transporter substrate-binding protein [Segeticoccus sp.]HET8601022.1 N-acetylglucosamine/diacetylchitobiose ABC transporter substrate-binding protein [Segeticoccus sp.]